MQFFFLFVIWILKMDFWFCEPVSNFKPINFVSKAKQSEIKLHQPINYYQKMKRERKKRDIPIPKIIITNQQHQKIVEKGHADRKEKMMRCCRLFSSCVHYMILITTKRSNNLYPRVAQIAFAFAVCVVFFFIRRLYFSCSVFFLRPSFWSTLQSIYLSPRFLSQPNDYYY